MTTISVIPLASTIGPDGQRLDTMQLRYPRFIHAECKTHRIMEWDEPLIVETDISLMDADELSRNASSSRAIPIRRMIAAVQEDPAEPVEWGRNKPGMQAGAAMTGLKATVARVAWHAARHAAVMAARVAAAAGAHKQTVNRMLEPWGHIDVIVSSTEWANFFDLRCHEDADPTMRTLAETMRNAYLATEPRRADPGEPGWSHLPLVDQSEIARIKVAGLSPELVAAGRLARVSYGNARNTRHSLAEDAALGIRLLNARHMSPFEHIARPDHLVEREKRVMCHDPTRWRKYYLHGNFNGFVQCRRHMEGPRRHG